ncbi:MAG: MOSC N-terminal beta barrel domain-containing protein [Cyanobacteria bacterium P01_A01_bin.45]
MAYVTKICIYPIKSLDGVEVSRAKVLASGSLEYDRQYAIFDEKGKFVNGKRYGKIHLLRAKFNLENNAVSLSVTGSDTEENFHLQADRKTLEAWLSDFFGFYVKLQENLVTGFPDDTRSPAPTFISTATIKEVASWYEGKCFSINEGEIRRRLRTTVEIDGVPAFWEDGLFSDDISRDSSQDKSSGLVPFRVGNISFVGVNPCQRCIVFARDCDTGEQFSDFQKIFIVKRQESLPQWVARSRFSHFYKLSVNTKLAPGESGNKIMRVTDDVSLLN